MDGRAGSATAATTNQRHHAVSALRVTRGTTFESPRLDFQRDHDNELYHGASIPTTNFLSRLSASGKVNKIVVALHFGRNNFQATENMRPKRDYLRVKKLGGVGTPLLLFALYNGTAQLRRARTRAQSLPRCSRFGNKAKKTIEDLFFLEATVATDLSLVPTRNFIRVPSTGNERREQLVRVRPECENCRKLASGKHFWKP
uniref:Uncharacterized protein n=1 Tax=Vespula pensylvanica TaxID=30213 RepID=A0A834KQ13_VESPE|nr:hypothetical protein H0235_013270 [Vespula pensylvanica]